MADYSGPLEAFRARYKWRHAEIVSSTPYGFFLAGWDAQLAVANERAEKAEAQNAALREALTVLANGGDFGAVDVPAHTGDIYIALQKFARAALTAEGE